MNPRTRRRFDEQLEWVLERLPPLVHQLLEKVPLHVEDYPPASLLAELGIEHRDELCGLFTGIALSEQSVGHSGMLPDVVTIYREGIMAAAMDRRGRVNATRLRREIRTTILHELAHYHGFSDEDLERLGYD
jgi:predicted Zn-dependent protease with MMP-like domain